MPVRLEQFETKLVSTKVLTVVTNGGYVDIEVQHDTGSWVLLETVNTDGARILTDLIDVTVRFTPYNGAEFNLLGRNIAP